MNPIEIAAVALGLVNIVLVARRSVWNYPFGIAMVILYARIFFDATLYSDALLQGFFLVAQLYGWWNWQRSRAETGTVRIELLGNAARVAWGAGAAAAIVMWGNLMARYTDASHPNWDASVAILSVVAQVLQSRRVLESWLVWILVDILSIGLYAAKALMLTMGLYVVLLALAIWGFFQWRRARRAPA